METNFSTTLYKNRRIGVNLLSSIKDQPMCETYLNILDYKDYRAISIDLGATTTGPQVV